MNHSTFRMVRRIAPVLIAFMLAFVLASHVTAMSSTNYRLDWYTPLTSGGGGPAASANFKINFSIGQSAIGNAASVNYKTSLGYWAGITDLFRLFMPAIRR